ncbi:MAG: hypothetical protein SWO11_14740 [Thermodesulfobacteriota bacterium]|nr:hypothetical protein [Thermodesulfobacteriota bacterium]
MFHFTEEQNMIKKLGAEKLASLVEQIEDNDEFSWELVHILGKS